MKLFSTLLFTYNLMAGDLFLVCFKGQDQGDFVGELTSFDFSKNEVQLDLSFYPNQIYYHLRVTRKSLFHDYLYEIYEYDQIGNLLAKKKYSITNYDDIIPLNKKINCQVTE